jgi:hypothetical protein
MEKARYVWELKLPRLRSRMPGSGDNTVERKIAENKIEATERSVESSTLAPRKGLVGATLMGAAIGAVAGGLLRTALRSSRHERHAGILDLDLELTQIAGYVQKHLGYQTTAYLTGVDDDELVSRWIAGTALPDGLPAQRLRSAFKATRHLVEAYDAPTAESWFLGMNPTFDDVAPVEILREGRDSQALEDVVLAAQEFAEN